MNFGNLEGFEEFFSDGVLDPSITSPIFRDTHKKYKKLTDRVYLLYDPQQAAKEDGDAAPAAAAFDIVFLHGIGSDEFNCWTNANGLLWPAAYLTQDFPNARLITVGYAHSLWNWKPDAEKNGNATAAELGANGANIKRIGEASSAQQQQQKQRPTNTNDNTEGSATSTQEGKVQSTKGSGDGSWGTAWSSLWGDGKELPSLPWKKTEDGTEGPAAKGSTKTEAEDSTPSVIDADGAPSALPQSTFKKLFLNAILLETVEDEDTSRTPALVEDDSTHKSDPRSLQSFHRVAADIAERLLSPEVGVGKRPIVFVVHSMGGLIIKDMIVSLFSIASRAERPAGDFALPAFTSTTTTSTGSAAAAAAATALATPGTTRPQEEAIHRADELLRSIRGVVFYSTPHFGSAIASIVTGLRRYYQTFGGLTPTHVVTGLGDHNKHELTLLNDHFMDVVERTRLHAGKSSNDKGGAAGGISILSFGETRKLNGLVRVVDPESSNPAPDDPRFRYYLIDADHSYINRPLSKTSPSYAMLYGFLDRLEQRGVLSAPPRQPFSSFPPSQAALLTSGEESSTQTAEAATAATASAPAFTAKEEETWRALFTPAPPAIFVTGDSYEQCKKLEKMLEKEHPTRLNRYQTAMSLHLLDDALEQLRIVLHSFFGSVIPSELDGIFLLGADIKEFVVRHTSWWDFASVHDDNNVSHAGGISHEARKQPAFVIPIELLLYWTKRCMRIVRSFEVNQAERLLTAATVYQVDGNTTFTSSSKGEGFIPHLSTGELREMKNVEYEVNLLQGEWEAFRRQVSITYRKSVAESHHHHAAGKGPVSSSHKGSEVDYTSEGLSSKRMTSLSFSHAIFAIMTHDVHDGGAFGGLMSQYLQSVMDRVSALTEESNTAFFKLRHRSSDTNKESAASSTAAAAAMSGLIDQQERQRLATGSESAAAVLPEHSSFAALFSEEKGSAMLRTFLGIEVADAEGLKKEGHIVSLSLVTISYVLEGCYKLFIAPQQGDTNASAFLCFEGALQSIEEARLALSKRELEDRVKESNNTNWWVSAADKKALADAKRERRHKGEVLASSVELLTCALKCWTLSLDIFTKQSNAVVALLSPQEPTALDNASEKLLEAVRVALAAYAKTEVAFNSTASSVAELEKPFASTETKDAKADKTSIETKGKEGEEDSVQKAKRAFRDAVTMVLKDLDSDESITLKANEATGKPKELAISNKGQSSAIGKESAFASSSSMKSPSTWFSSGSAAASSVPAFLFKSFLSAWETVRHGGESSLTPASYASNVRIFWWLVEEQVKAILSRYVETTDVPNPCLLQTLEELKERGCSPARKGAPFHLSHRSAQPAASAAKAAAVESSTQKGAEEANDSLRSQWTATKGYLTFAHFEKHRRNLQRGDLERILSSDADISTIVAAARTSSASATAAEATLCPGSVSSLEYILDAFHMDRDNALARCLFGHHHFFRSHPSIDAMQSYLSVLSVQHSPQQELFRVAAVGLGWGHLHHVRATMDNVVWRVARSTACQGHVGVGGSSSTLSSLSSKLATWASFADRKGDCVVLDPLSLRAAPAEYLDFCRDAIDLSVLSSVSSPTSPNDGKVSNSGGGSDGDDAFFPGGHASHSGNDMAPHRLRLAREYFESVLAIDPTNVGALCGLGRIHSLAVDYTNIFDHQQQRRNFLNSMRATGGKLGSPNLVWSPDLREAERYFRAAAGVMITQPTAHFTDISHGSTDKEEEETAGVGNLSVTKEMVATAAVRKQFPSRCPAKRFADATLEPIFASYAAFWVGSLTHPPLSQSMLGALAMEWYKKRVTSSAPEEVALPSSVGDQCLQHYWLAMHEAAAWYKRSLVCNPFNDWAMTSLGLFYVQRADTGARSTARDSTSEFTGLLCTPPSQLNPVEALRQKDAARGLALLRHALAVNPANQQALWGVGRYEPDAVLRSQCQEKLKRQFYRRCFLRR